MGHHNQQRLKCKLKNIVVTNIDKRFFSYHGSPVYLGICLLICLLSADLCLGELEWETHSIDNDIHYVCVHT